MTIIDKEQFERILIKLGEQILIKEQDPDITPKKAIDKVKQYTRQKFTQQLHGTSNMSLRAYSALCKAIGEHFDVDTSTSLQLELIGLDTNILPYGKIYVQDEIRWQESIPASIEQEQQLENLMLVDLGRRFFHELMINRVSLEDFVKRENRTNPNLEIPDVITCFRMALWSGVIKLLHVPYAEINLDKHNNIDPEIRESIKSINVVKTPTYMKNGREELLDLKVVNTEFVAHVAAQQILMRDRVSQILMHGGGYTMERFAFNTMPNKNSKNLSWIPIQAFENDLYTINARSSNGVATILHSIHPNSSAFYLPYLPFKERHKILALGTEDKQAQTLERLRTKIRNAQPTDPIVLTVGGIENGEFAGADSQKYTFSSVNDLYTSLDDSLKAKVVGEFLGYLVDANCQIVVDTADLQERQYDISYVNGGIEFVKKYPLWLIASGSFKTNIAKAVMRKYATYAIIDRPIAKNLRMPITGWSNTSFNVR